MKSLRKDDKGLLFELLIGAGMAIIIFFAVMFIGTFINATIDDSLVGALGMQVSGNDGVTIFYNNTELAARANRTLVNLSGDFDDVADALAIAAIVMAITLPLAAVVAIRRFL